MNLDGVKELFGFHKKQPQEAQTQAQTQAATNLENWSKVAPDTRDKYVQAAQDGKKIQDIREELNAPHQAPASLDDQPLSLPQQGEAGYVAPTAITNEQPVAASISEATPVQPEPTQIPVAAENTPPAPSQEPAKEEPAAA